MQKGTRSAEDTGVAADETRRTLVAALVVGVLLAGAVAYAALTKGAESPTPAATSDTTATAPSAAETTAASVVSRPASGTPGSLPASVTPPGAPTAVAAPGSELTSLTAPPSRTIGMFAVPKGFTSARYAIVFKPFGWGPSGPGTGRLIAQIVSAKPLDEAAKSLAHDLAGRNATLWVDAKGLKVVCLGGTYSGTLVVRGQGDVGVLYLEDPTVGSKASN